MSVKLSYIVDDEKITSELDVGSYIIGRSKSCDVVIRAPSVSGQHLRIDVTEGKVSYRDLLSRNGTLVNGKKVEKGEVTGFETIRLGKVDIEMEPLNPAGLDFAPAPEAAHNENTPNNLEFAPPPSADNELALPEKMSPHDSNVEVFIPSEAHAEPEKPRTPVLLAILLLVCVLIVGGMFLNKSNKKDVYVSTGDPQEDYWQGMKQGSLAFAAGEYQNAYNGWKETERKYNEKTGDSFTDAQVFCNAIAPFVAVANGEVLTGQEDWRGIRGKLISLVDSSHMSSEMNNFAITLEKLCRREIVSMNLINEAAKLTSEKRWNEAMAKLRLVSGSSLYASTAKAQINDVATQRLDYLKSVANSAAAGGDYAEAIARAGEFFGLGGQSNVLASSLVGWKKTYEIQQSFKRIRKKASNAVTPADIESAREELADLRERFPDETMLVKDLTPLLNSLTSKLFVLRLETFYREGDSRGVVNHMKTNPLYEKNAEVADILRRWKKVSSEKNLADKAEEISRIEIATDHWKNIIATEQDDNNRFRIYAVSKLKEYPPEKIAEMLIKAAVKAMNKSEYKQARISLDKARELTGGNQETIDKLEATAKILSKKGKRTFNRAIQFYSTGQYARAKDSVNDARDCFNSTDPFRMRIDAWMIEKNVAVRD